MFSTPKRTVGSRGARTLPRAARISPAKRAALNRRFNRQGQRAGARLIPRLRTLTATRARQADPLEHRGGSESSFVLFKPVNGRLAGLSNQLRPLSFVQNGSGILNATIGKQKQDSVLNLYYPTDITTMLANAATIEYGTSTPTGYKSLDIYLKSVFATIAITNSENADTRIVLYDVIWKKDIVNDSSGNAGFLNTLITDGITDVGGGATGATLIGTRPYDSPAFTEYCSVRKTTNIILAPGQTHYHTVNYHPNQRVNAEHMRAQSGGMQAFGNLSYGLVAQHYGSPVKDNAGTGVTTSATNLIYVSQMDYQFSFIPSNVTTLSITNSLGTTQNTNLENPITGTSTAFAQV